MVTFSFMECPCVSETVIVVPGGPLFVVTLVTVNEPVPDAGETLAIDVSLLTAEKVPL
jgi:hypothetical protein